MLELFRKDNERFKRVIARTRAKCVSQHESLTRQRESLERQRQHLADVRALNGLDDYTEPTPGAAARAVSRPEDSRR